MPSFLVIQEAKTGTLIKWLGEAYVYSSGDRLLMEAELNKRFALLDDQYFRDRQAMLQGDYLEEKRRP